MAEFSEVKIKERIRQLSPVEFEQFVAALWELQGWTTERTTTSGDGGRDIIAERNLPFPLRLKIEVKQWCETERLSPIDLRQYAILPGDDADLAVVVTSSSIIDAARQTVTQHKIKLVDSPRLVALIHQLDAEPLLTDELAVDDWEQVRSKNHLDWTVDGLGDRDPVDAIPGIGEKYAEQLADVDIHNITDLVIADPAELAAKTDFAESRLRRWVNLAAFHAGGERTDAIDGIDQQAMLHLSEAEIYTADELIAACAKELASQTALNEQTLKNWIGAAASRDVVKTRGLPRIGEKRAAELAKVGIFTASDLVATEPDDIAEQIDLSRGFLQDLIQTAQTHQQ
jgi:predicted flap endonuclease-1-like 5' DNA nuclease